MMDGFDYEDYVYSDDDDRSIPTTLYFCRGAYTISLEDQVFTASGERSASYRVVRSEYATDKSPSLLDIYEIFENSYLLEFMISVLSDGIINIRSCKKLININEDDACIFCTANFSNNQKFIKLEDDIESDTQVTEIININSSQVMRTHQSFMSVTQPVKYCVANYDIIHSDTLDWMGHNVDWQLVYNNYAEPYIKMLISSYLRIKVDKVFQYKEYMDFCVQFNIARSPRSFHEEIYILPNSVFGRDLVYNMDDGREVMLSNQNADGTGITSDEFRVCMGTQNLTLLPIDIIKIYHTIENGKSHLVYHETSNPDDTFFNYFLLAYHRFSYLPSDMILWVTCLDGFEQCPYNIIVTDNIDDYDKLKTQEEKDVFILEHTKHINSLVQFFGVSNSITDQLSTIKATSNGQILGTICISLEEYIKPDALVYTIEEDINNPDELYFPKKFYDSLITKYKLSKNSNFTLIPIRALPKYREFMVLVTNPDSKNDKTQSDIIEKNKGDLIEKGPKRHFFQSLFGK